LKQNPKKFPEPKEGTLANNFKFIKTKNEDTVYISPFVSAGNKEKSEKNSLSFFSPIKELSTYFVRKS